MQTEKNPTLKDSKTIVKNGFTVNPSQLVYISEKEWGHEEWIANTPQYCGKKLIFNEGYQCSMHQHKIKDETFYIQSGTVILETDYHGKLETRFLSTGDTAHILPEMWHRITALSTAEVFEFSTFHMEDDSYRRTKSGKANLQAMGITGL